jgi:hypothetical protein
MIVLSDSCSWVTSGALSRGAGLKYVNKSSFGSAGLGTGRYGGQSYTFTNAGFGQILYAHAVTPQPWLYDSRQLAVTQGRNPESIIWQWGAIATPFAPLAYVTLRNDGKLAIYAGGDGVHANSGTQLYVSQTALDLNNYHSVDLAWNFPASGQGSVALYIDDVLDTLTPGHPSVEHVTWGGQPSAFAFCWKNLASSGYEFSDLVVNDSTGSYNNSRLGPCRVQVYFPSSDGQPIGPSGWLITTSDSSLKTGASVLNEAPGFAPDGQAPDGDFAYIASATPGSTYVAELGRYSGVSLIPGLDCTALILGLMWCACVREPASTPQELLVVPNPSNGVPFSLGTPAVASAYNIVQAASEVRPDTSTVWTDGEAGNAWWGIEYAGGAPAVTQMFLEKITTTRSGVPFNCGQLGSYSYQH